jgi:hypothetical protein
MERVVKVEAKNGLGRKVETIEVGKLRRRVVGLTVKKRVLYLAEGKVLRAEPCPLSTADSDGRVCRLLSRLARDIRAPNFVAPIDHHDPWQIGMIRCSGGVTTVRGRW